MIAFIIMDPTRVDGRGPGPGIPGGGPGGPPRGQVNGLTVMMPGSARAGHSESSPGPA